MKKIIILFLLLSATNSYGAWIVQDTWTPPFPLCDGSQDLPPNHANPNTELYNQCNIINGSEGYQDFQQMPALGWIDNNKYGYQLEYWDGTTGYPWRRRYKYYTVEWIYSENCAPIDSDNDGIPDEEDLMPHDGESTQYQVLEKVYDSDGNLIYQKIMTANENGSVTGVQTFGDEVLAQQIKAGITDGTVLQNSTYEGMFDDPYNTNLHDIDDLGSDLQTDIDGNTQETGLWNTDQSVSEIDATPVNESATSDPGSQITTDIIDNTGQFTTMIDNQGAIIQNQTNQRSVSEKTNELLAGIKDELSDQQNTEVYVETDLEELVGSGTLESYTGTIPDVEFENVTETELSEYSELNAERDWYQEIVDVLATNPFTDALEGVELQASGSCSLSWDYKGHTIEMGVCGHETELNFWGSVILMISGLHAIFIIFKR